MLKSEEHNKQPQEEPREDYEVLGIRKTTLDVIESFNRGDMKFNSLPELRDMYVGIITILANGSRDPEVVQVSFAYLTKASEMYKQYVKSFI